MEKFLSGIRSFKMPQKNEVIQAIFSFTKKERFVFLALLIMLLASTLLILNKINTSFMVSIPMEGGSITEGIVGTPRFINPVLAFGDADKDMVALIYSGLMRKGTDGNLLLDLAERYDVSKDGLIYTFTLKDGATFHDGEKVTASDILFTINSVKDDIIKSPRKRDWDGVSAEKIDEKTIKFTLRQPYASFLENVTMGILPEHLWANSPIELNDANMNPIGSGPYKVDGMNKSSAGNITSYSLVSFKKFILGRPYVKNIDLKFYTNENDLLDALKSGDIDQASYISPENAGELKMEGKVIATSVLPRVFGIFFNQNQNQIFTNKNIVKAIDKAIDKDRIVNQVLLGYGIAIDDPIPPNMLMYQKLNAEQNKTMDEKRSEAKGILAKDGWTLGEDGFLEKITTDKKKKKTTQKLEFSISTGNVNELADSAMLIKEDLESIGIKVDIKTFDTGNLNQMFIRPRKYDALLFGQIINHESDLYAFWHSSQRKDPGLNVAMYTNAKVDKILEDAFITVDPNTRVKKYAQFEDEIKKDMPAVFVYSPNFLYVVKKGLGGMIIDHTIIPSDRFLGSYLWYTKVDNIWKIFAR